MQGMRLLLLPFSWIYSLLITCRNWLFNVGWKKSEKIPGAAICIGNITVGGTGKSPLTVYIAEALAAYEPVILSRGYGRKTKGPVIAQSSSTATELGDEPLMYWQHFHQKVPVIVAEQRQAGVDWIRANHPQSTILLDDAFQHRAVQAGLSIVLMTFDRPIFRDFTFPAGNLREPRSGIKRADIVIITKCPEQLTESEKAPFYRNIALPQERIFFSRIEYGSQLPLFDHPIKSYEHILLVTGIAQPAPLKRFLSEHSKVESLQFPDHHDFSLQDIQKIQQKVANFATRECAIVITVKDAVKLTAWKEELEQLNRPIFIQTMTVRIENEEEFKDLLLNYVVRANEGSR